MSVDCEDMARPIRFKTLFFRISKGSEYIENAIKNINNQKTYVLNRKKYRLEKYEEENDYLYGDLQQMHYADATKITLEKEVVINSENFNENELLGYNNVFCYNKAKHILAMQHNANGVGFQSFEDMLNQASIWHETLPQELIEFSIIESKDKFNDVTNFNTIEFSIEKYQNIDDTSFVDFNNLHNKTKFTDCKIICKSESFLDFQWVKQIVPTLQNNKQIKLKSLKTECILSSGENAELNFLSNKAQTIQDIESNATLDYNKRKNIIKQHIQDFIKEYE